MRDHERLIAIARLVGALEWAVDPDTDHHGTNPMPFIREKVAELGAALTGELGVAITGDAATLTRAGFFDAA